MRAHVTVAFWILSAAGYAQVACPCDPHDPETLRERQCSLCAQAEKQPPSTMVSFVQDINPRKPNRWLAIPRQHSPGMHQMSALPPDARAELWRAAIAKSKELWGDHWAVAYNAERFHTQCHVHVHIGKLLDGVEWGEFKVVNSPDEIPLPGEDGLWIHAVDGKLHVHLGEQVTENVLLR
jgi:diadenosine tetraphosphate (Ap4A) HIT family hydrolase